jgi:hypothetical protein
MELRGVEIKNFEVKIIFTQKREEIMKISKADQIL